MKRSHVTGTADDATSLRVVPDFFDGAAELRAAFDRSFAEQRRVSPARFVWDYWHVPDQYTYLHTFPDRVFPRSVLARFLARLASWGLQHLGCGEVTEPWLSFYVDGCVQELHTDPAQGTWAYVFSLTHWDRRRFGGGETIMLRREALQEAATPRETPSLFDTLPAHFNQLLVFDARVPHGVRRLTGVQDPLESRIVMHGWFKEPRIVLSGFDAEAAAAVEERAKSAVAAAATAELHGLVVLAITIAGGKATRVDILTNHLGPNDGRALGDVTAALRKTRWPRGASGTITLPVRVQSSAPRKSRGT
jgi:hypothetical protein